MGRRKNRPGLEIAEERRGEEKRREERRREESSQVVDGGRD